MTSERTRTRLQPTSGLGRVDRHLLKALGTFKREIILALKSGPWWGLPASAWKLQSRGGVSPCTLPRTTPLPAAPFGSLHCSPRPGCTGLGVRHSVSVAPHGDGMDLAEASPLSCLWPCNRVQTPDRKSAPRPRCPQGWSGLSACPRSDWSRHSSDHHAGDSPSRLPAARRPRPRPPAGLSGQEPPPCSGHLGHSIRPLAPARRNVRHASEPSGVSLARPALQREGKHPHPPHPPPPQAQVAFYAEVWTEVAGPPWSGLPARRWPSISTPSLESVHGHG